MATQTMVVTVPDIRECLVRSLDGVQACQGMMETKVQLPDPVGEVLITRYLGEDSFKIVLGEDTYLLKGPDIFKAGRGTSWKVNRFDLEELRPIIERLS